MTKHELEAPAATQEHIDLHAKLLAELLDRLNNQVHCEQCGRGAMSAGELEVIRKFLSDNCVNVSFARGRNNIRAITEALPFREPCLRPAIGD